MKSLKIVIPYRNRSNHLNEFQRHMKMLSEKEQVNVEVIVVEQNDEFIFRRGSLRNFGVDYLQKKYPSMDMSTKIAIHDVDYLPSTLDDYFLEGPVILPVKYVKFLTNELRERLVESIPSGYRHFDKGVDDDFFGGVSVFTLEAYLKTGGFNPLYAGWGLEDADLRERVKDSLISITRGNTIFFALEHEDSFPGLHDENFRNNQTLYDNRKNYYHVGLNNMSYVVDEEESIDLGTKIKISNLILAEDKNILNVNNLSVYYTDTPQVHTHIWNSFEDAVNSYELLKSHRDFIELHNLGYGDRPFHWMWNLLIRDMPKNFKFLEIGVFKGQVVSLISLLNKELKKNGSIFGITPLNSSGDKYGTHPDDNYEELIMRLYASFGLDAGDLTIIQGYSNDPDIIKLTQDLGTFDIVYVDGCHDYEVVVSDLKEYGELIKVGGYLVVDDASNNLAIPDGLIRMNWRGLLEVSQATKEVVESDDRFVHKFAVGHNRVFQRVK